jgi:hypothetical protein
LPWSARKPEGGEPRDGASAGSQLKAILENAAVLAADTNLHLSASGPCGPPARHEVRKKLPCELGKIERVYMARKIADVAISTAQIA